MKPKGEFLICILVAVCFSTVYGAYTNPTQITLVATPFSPPENVATWKVRLWTGFIGYLILTIALSLLLWNSYKAWQLQKEERRRILQYFGLYIFFYMLATLFMTIEAGVFNLWYGLSFPLAIPLSILFSGFAPFFLLKFNYWVVNREKPEIIRNLSVLLPLAVLIGFMILQGITIVSRGLLLAVNLIAVIQVMIFVSTALREELNVMKKVSLQTLLAGLIASLGFFFFYTLDALNPVPYSVIMNFAFLSGFLASVLLFLGTVMPEWYVSWIRNHIS